MLKKNGELYLVALTPDGARFGSAEEKENYCCIMKALLHITFTVDRFGSCPCSSFLELFSFLFEYPCWLHQRNVRF